MEKWPIVAFLGCASLCLLSSTIYHLFTNISLNVKAYLRRLDYASINFLISGTTISFSFYGFYCDPDSIRTFCAISITTSILLFALSLTETFHERWRVTKVVLYGASGISAALPIFTLMMRHSTDPFRATTVMPLYILMGFCYLGGLAIYAVRFP